MCVCVCVCVSVCHNCTIHVVGLTRYPGHVGGGRSGLGIRLGYTCMESRPSSFRKIL